MIEAQGLTKIYGSVVAVNGVSFSVRKGEVVGFLGRNGAGKTTTMRMLTGYAAPTKGSALIGGFDVAEHPVEAKRLVGYLPEKPPVYDDLTVDEYLRFTARIKGVPGSRLKARLDETSEACGLKDVRRRLVGNLSKGYKQRVGLAQALVHEPQVLILDEPTVGLDPGQIIEIRELIKKLHADRTIILSTHILQEVTASCDKVIVIHKGNVVAQDSIANLTSRGQRARVVVEGVPPHEEAEAAMRALPAVRGVTALEHPGAFDLTLNDAPLARAEVARFVVQKGWHLLELRPTARTLEEAFLELTDTASTAPPREGQAQA